jgi:fucose 4-O-acetylase-like acetyltransferase
MMKAEKAVPETIPETIQVTVPKPPSRIVWIDYARFIGIWLVVYAHSGVTDDLWRFFSVVVLQILIFLSGYLEKNNKTVLQSITGGCKSILLPYVLLYAVAYVYWFVIDFILHIDMYTFQPRESGPVVFTLLKPVIGMLLGQGTYESTYSMMLVFPMWFMPALFFVRIYHSIIIAFAKDSIGRYCLGLAVLLLVILGLNIFETRFFRIPFGVDCGLLLFPFFAFGNVVRRMNFISKMKPPVGLPGIVLHLLVAAVGFAFIWVAIPYNGTADVNVFYFGENLILYVLLGYAGIISVLAIALLFNKPDPICSRISTGTLLIMAFHGILIPYINRLALIFNMEFNNWSVIVLSVLNVGFFIIPIGIVQRYFPVLIGGRKSGA